ncbi:MAG: DUF2062 domain-containing protein [Vicinamibacterales bacterium]
MRVRPQSAFFPRLVQDLRTEGGGPRRDAAAIGLGAMIGCTPFFGFHLLLVIALGRLLRLNRLKMYLASNISNPLMAPALILVEIQVGAWLRRDDLHNLSLATLETRDPWTFGGDLLLGSIVVGVTLGVMLAAATYMSAGRAPRLPRHIADVLDRAADRYLPSGIAAWEMARGKLRHDPVYAAALTTPLPHGGTFVDVGCGRGLMLAAIVEASAAHGAHRWPADADPPPCFGALVGVELGARMARLARRALGEAADIRQGDARTQLPASASAAAVFDVLHLMPAEHQEELVRALAAMLEPGGVLLVREVDAAAGFGFHLVRIGNCVKNVLVGNWRMRFHFRTASEWHSLFARRGLEVEIRPMGHGTPFANVFFRLQKGPP